jgi:hypothetical protein
MTKSNATFLEDEWKSLCTCLNEEGKKDGYRCFHAGALAVLGLFAGGKLKLEDVDSLDKQIRQALLIKDWQPILMETLAVEPVTGGELN